MHHIAMMGKASGPERQARGATMANNRPRALAEETMQNEAKRIGSARAPSGTPTGAMSTVDATGAIGASHTIGQSMQSV